MLDGTIVFAVLLKRARNVGHRVGFLKITAKVVGDRARTLEVLQRHLELMSLLMGLSEVSRCATKLHLIADRFANCKRTLCAVERFAHVAEHSMCQREI